jgi:uncharacterized protein
MILLARRAGATPAQLGLAPATVPQGVSAGLVAGIPIGSIVALGAFLPATEKFFREERIVRASGVDVAYELLVHIPLATVLAEELMFRGAIEAAFWQRRSQGDATLISGALFGAWHILPALDRTLSNPGVRETHGTGIARQAVIVVIVCAATSVAGFALSWLRRRSGSLLAPLIVHFAANAGGFLGGWLASRRSRA